MPHPFETVLSELCTQSASNAVSEILAYLMKHNLIDGNNMTVTGLTLGENLERWTHKYGELSFAEQDVIRPLDKPIKETGHLRYSFSVQTC